MLCAKGLTYWGRVGFVVLFAVAAGVLGHRPNWNWWGFSTGYTLVALADLTLGCFFAALVIARVVKPS